MTLTPPPEFDAFRTLSARLGQDPLQVQGPGGNTSLKEGDTLWIKASGTELANAETQEVFLPVSRPAALAEARREAGDGSCKTTGLDPANTLRPSIETTFHAALDWPVVLHTHSIAALTHGVSVQGREAAREKLAGLPFALVPYAKPGLPLTGEILTAARPETQVFVLENHGLIVCGPDVDGASAMMEEVERRLALSALASDMSLPSSLAPEGFDWAPESWIARTPGAAAHALAGSYYPDHVVFLGPALPRTDHEGTRPALLIEDTGIALRHGATASQRAMLRCLSDFLIRLPEAWAPLPIGPDAEAELLNWDAEKYRQALAARQ